MEKGIKDPNEEITLAIFREVRNENCVQSECGKLNPIAMNDRNKLIRLQPRIENERKQLQNENEIA